MTKERNLTTFALSALLIAIIGTTTLMATENKSNNKKKTEKQKAEKKKATVSTPKDNKKRYKLGTSKNPGKCGL